MGKKFGNGVLIIAEQLKDGDFYKENAKQKVRFEAAAVTITTKVEVSSSFGPRSYANDDYLILVQRDGMPVPAE